MKKVTCLLLLAFMVGTVNATVMDESLYGGGNRAAKPAALPNTQLRVHDVGKVWLSVTNFGFFGSQEGEFEDASGRYDPAPGCQFPGGSSLDYLFQGALWIGAEIQYDSTDAFGNTIQVFDTLVSIGNDGWWGNIFEFYPADAPNGEIMVRSIRPSNVYPYGDTTEAISEQDYVAVYFDTSTSSFVVPDPNDQRPHIPLGIEIEQRSYASPTFFMFPREGNQAPRMIYAASTRYMYLCWATRLISAPPGSPTTTAIRRWVPSITGRPAGSPASGW